MPSTAKQIHQTLPYPAHNIFCSKQWMDRMKEVGIYDPSHIVRNVGGIAVAKQAKEFLSDFESWPQLTVKQDLQKAIPGKKVDVVQFHKLPLESCPNKLPSGTRMRPMMVSPFLDLEKRGLPETRRINKIKKSRKRIERDYGELSLKEITDREKGQWLDCFETLYKKRQTQKGLSPLFSDPIAKESIEKWILGAPLQPWMKLLQYCAGETTIGIGLFYLWEGVFYYQHPTYNTEGDLHKHSPGLVFTQTLVEWVAAQGCHTFDFLQGDEGYKYIWLPEERKVYFCEVPLSLKGRVITSIRHWIYRLKSPSLRARRAKQSPRF